ncbi:MAG: hypothetical protein GY757_16430 [bacterium]|nr:hypothetical protein [bacterium]
MALAEKLITGFKKIEKMNYGSRFYRTDLHFHTPASEDARGSNKYDVNPYKIKFPSSKKRTPANIQKTKEMKEEILADCRKTAQDIVKRFRAENLGLVAITDHNGLGTIRNDDDSSKRYMDLAAPTWYELIDDEARKINREAGETLLTILPGVEISTTDIHILAIFPPQEPRRKIHFILCDLLHETGFDVDEWGKNPKVGKTSVYNTIELIIKKGGLPIIAHVDAHAKALLKLYEIKGAAMKNVLQNHHLHALEIVKPKNLSKKNKEVGAPLAHWFREVREKAELSDFAYFQGSDAHCLEDIAKRSTYVKMTEPSFEGLKIAINIPSSRVRLYDYLEDEKKDGSYIYGVEIDHESIKKCKARFNPHLNCVVGKKKEVKTAFFNFLREAIEAGVVPGFKGSVRIYFEKVVDSKSQFFVVGNDNGEPYLYSLDPLAQKAEKLDWDQLESLNIRPVFYSQDIASATMSTNEDIDAFLLKLFGPPTEQNIAAFNELFAISHFLEEEKSPLLFAEAGGDSYKLYLNTNWGGGKVKKVAFSKLETDLKRLILTCIIIINGKAGPLVIDAHDFPYSNEYLVNFLLPILKKYKDFRQIVLFTNHPIVAVNADPENYMLLKPGGVGKPITLETGFSIDKKEQKEELVKILEGSARAFKKRIIRYNFDG